MSDETASSVGVPAPEAAATPRRGRPRDESVEQNVLDATLALAGEVGINGMSMDEVAQRAGVSKATIYRRWSSKEALVLDALSSAIRPFDDTDTGSLRGDLHGYLTELGERMASGKSSDILPHLIEVSIHDAGLRASLDRYVQNRRLPLGAILARAIERGDLPSDTDVEVLIDTFIGSFVYRRLLTRAALDDDFVTRLVAVVLSDL